jgi:peptide/nickel transport system ATP-binding protein/oligopeptide transport system ATP-binding protein
MDRFIVITNLTKEYYGRGFLNRRNLAVRAVDRVSFEIERNTVFGLVGESGCGKTTLVRSILYLDPPTSGEVKIDGTSIGDLSSRELRSFRKRMQIVFQDPNSALNPKMRIDDSLAEGLVNRGLPAAERNKRIEHLLDLVGIAATHRTRFPHEFSGGQKQRIVIARALCMEPDFLVLDEPVSNLDVSIQAQIINLLLDLKRELALTYLFISHDLNLVGYFSDRLGVMYQGRLVELASAEKLINNPCHPYTRKLFSSVPGKQAEIEIELDQEPEASRVKPAGMNSVCCPYANECSIGDQQCKTDQPELAEIAAGHRVACLKMKGSEVQSSGFRG